MFVQSQRDYVQHLHATLRTSYLDKIGKILFSNEICRSSSVKQKTSGVTLHATRQAVRVGENPNRQRYKENAFFELNFIYLQEILALDLA